MGILGVGVGPYTFRLRNPDKYTLIYTHINIYTYTQYKPIYENVILAG